ncbi:MAG: hypothetical protein OEY06_11130 [Gammaproteobacteria bacterium]|nr:hypothetical protein [Gammaproteobacteria bacterium]
MRSIKAVLVGSLFIVIAILLMQLAYIFIAVAYNSLAKDYALLNDIAGSFRYLVGIPLFMVIMFFGGYVTADFARTKVIPHCLVVGIITASGMIVPTLENSNLTITGIVIFIMAIGASSVGGLYWQRANK